jgi:hypothetical protein
MPPSRATVENVKRSDNSTRKTPFHFGDGCIRKYSFLENDSSAYAGCPESGRR